MLAVGKLQPSRSPIFTAPQGGTTVTSIKLVNRDAGTTSCTVNLYVNPKGTIAHVPIIPRNTTLHNGRSLDETTVRRLREGDQLEGDVSAGSDVSFEVN